MKPITSRQQQTLDFIKKYIAVNGYSPSMREIGDGIDSLSPSTIQAIIGKLEDKGFITRQHNVPRSIRVVGQGDSKDALIRSQKEEINRLMGVNQHLEIDLTESKVITELSVKALGDIKSMLDMDHSGYQKYQIWKAAFDALEDVKKQEVRNE